MSDVDLDVAESFERIFPVPAASAEWDDVLERARVGRPRQHRHRRRLVLVVAALLVVVVASASAFGTVRALLFGQRQIAAVWFGPATWSPDGGRIAFLTIACSSRCGGGAVELNVMNADGSGQRNLTREARFEDVARFQGVPVWSPDGRTLAFAGGTYRSSDLYVVNADGSGRRRVTQGPSADGDAVWSPNGRRLAFVRVRGGRADIHVVNANGSGLRRLAHAIAFTPSPGAPGEGWRANPTWSSDGRRIAFVSNRDGNFDVFVVNAEGNGLRNLTRNKRNDSDPTWSPDGRLIAFQGKRDAPSERERAACQPHCQGEEIYVVGADGSGLRRLTHNWRFDGAPIWSPNGRKILFVRNRGHHPDIYVTNADGSGKRNLTKSAAQPFATDTAPAWSPDGRKILFVSNRGDGNWFDVYVMNADGSDKRRLTQLKGQ